MIAALGGCLTLVQAAGNEYAAYAGLKGTVWTDVECIKEKACSSYTFDTDSRYSFDNDQLELSTSGNYTEDGNTIRMTDPSDMGLLYHEGRISGQEMSVRMYTADGKLASDAIHVYRRTK
jgi:hypothetical protein